MYTDLLPPNYVIPDCIFQEAQRALGELDGKYSGCEKTQDELQKEDSRVRHEKAGFLLGNF